MRFQATPRVPGDQGVHEPRSNDSHSTRLDQAENYEQRQAGYVPAFIWFRVMRTGCSGPSRAAAASQPQIQWTNALQGLDTARLHTP